MTASDAVFDGSAARGAGAPVDRSRLWWEIAIVLALGLGQSAVYSLLSFARRLLAPVPLGDQQTQLNPSRDELAVWDVVYQLLGIFFSLAVVALAIYLLWEPGRSAFARIGLNFDRLGGDIGRGFALAAVIGIPGLGLYAVSRVLGLSVAVVASPLGAGWWTIPVLVIAAVRAALLEEVIMIGYLFDRLRRLGWGPWTIILASAGLRGAYHAYQGFGGIVGNFAMGIVFGWAYKRWGRVMPLVVAHTLLDIVSFVGYPLATALWPGVFAPPAVTPSPGVSPSPSVSPTP